MLIYSEIVKKQRTIRKKVLIEDKKVKLEKTTNIGKNEGKQPLLRNDLHSVLS